MIERVHGFIGDDPQRPKSVGPRGQDKRDRAKSEETEFVITPIHFLSASRPHHSQTSGTAPGAVPRHRAQTPSYTPPSN